ncbi:hypothetical protein KUCAC02_034813, partial [Chaenocephalus aceratus]
APSSLCASELPPASVLQSSLQPLCFRAPSSLCASELPPASVLQSSLQPPSLTESIEELKTWSSKEAAERVSCFVLTPSLPAGALSSCRSPLFLPEPSLPAGALSSCRSPLSCCPEP